MPNDTRKQRLCTVDNCTKLIEIRGLCHMHNWRLKQWGTVDAEKSQTCIRDAKERLLRKRVITKTGCWEYQGAHNKQGYGLARFNGRSETAHRISARLFLGFKPKGRMCVCHRCDNPPCFNPSHLFIGTDEENNLDARKKGRWKPNKGEENGGCKTTEAVVLKVRRDYDNGLRIFELVKTYGMSRTQTKRIVTGVSWKYLLAS